MGSEADNAEAAAAGAVDSDGSVSWEEFFGTSTDLVPQLLGMFDELARRGESCSYGQHGVVVQQSEGTCNIPVAIQKRLSLVPHSQRSSIFGQLRSSSSSSSSESTMIVPSRSEPEAAMESPNKDQDEDGNANDLDFAESRDIEAPTPSAINEKAIYRRESSGLTPLRCSSRRSGSGRGAGSRPLSASSIASSTSSSGCSNQGTANAANPYLTSVESLADTCASSQGSGDSGVVTISEASCRIRDVGGRKSDGGEGDYNRYCDPHRNPVERVLMEIVDTEAIYVEHLRQVIQGYLIFWRDDPAGLVRQLQLNHLFSNIEDIFEFNREFLKEIESCGLDPICVANTFIKHNAGFKVYTEYCTNYPRTVSVLTDLMGQEGTANAFRERQAALGHALPLGSFLLKPVQRILKYHLLLENLSKEYGCEESGTTRDAKGQMTIEGALEAMTGIAKHINAMKRRHEHAVRVQEIQSLLYGWHGRDLTTSGELVAEGRFRMRGAKAPRHAFLFERMLLLTKKKEDGLLVYKAHIMCSNLMLIESIPGEPCTFHVIPFDNPRLQYTLQARNVEQKREWALQIKRVILENYNAVIPSHARQLVLELGQSQQDEDSSVDKGSAKKQYSAPPEYLEKRKQEKERRRSETGLRQKFKKNATAGTKASTENSPASERRKEYDNSAIHTWRDPSFNRSLDARASKVKDRFTNWRRKSEPGFQSYVSLNQSDDERNENNETNTEEDSSSTPAAERHDNDDDQSPLTVATDSCESKVKAENCWPSESKDVNEQQQTRTVEQIVGHILMQNHEFQRLLEKQRNNSMINVTRHQQRFHKHVCAAADTSDESETDNTSYPSETGKDNRCVRSNRREENLVRTNNAWNAFSSPQPRDVQPTLQLRYDNLRTENDKDGNDRAKPKSNRVYAKRAMFEAFKRQSIVTDSKIIKTALRIREHAGNDETNVTTTTTTTTTVLKGDNLPGDAAALPNEATAGFGNYDNLQHVWDGLHDTKDKDNDDSPTRPAVWLTKVCQDLPNSPHKAGSLPRNFQSSPNPQPQTITKARFLQRDGKPMSERPFTIASDKPAEINLEDMERYASSCQPEGRIAKFPTSSSTASSTFFLTLDDNLTDAYSETYNSAAAAAAAPVTSTNIHPDHKIYRANVGGSAIFKNVFSKARASRLQGLRTTASTETLESNDELERTAYSRSLTKSTTNKGSRTRLSRESSSDVEDHHHAAVGCVPASSGSTTTIPDLYYKQGSSGLGARIAQSDYADPSFLFSESKRLELAAAAAAAAPPPEPNKSPNKYCGEPTSPRSNETDSYYEKSFETIENYHDADGEDDFRDSAIFSDADETNNPPISSASNRRLRVAAPPVPAKRKPRIGNKIMPSEECKLKPAIAHKPSNLKVRAKIYPSLRSIDDSTKSGQAAAADADVKTEDRNDVSAGQSQAGWVRKMVGQLQAHIET